MTKCRAKFQVYQAADGFRWRLKSSNGNIIADSGEAYTRRAGAQRAVKRMKQVIALLSEERA